VPVSPHAGLSAYERARLENISRNEEYMRSLGLGAAKAQMRNVTTNKAKRKRSSKPPTQRDPNAVVVPRRRSKRVRNLPAVFDPSSMDSAGMSALMESEIQMPNEEELPFDDSKVCTYEAAAPQPQPQPRLSVPPVVTLSLETMGRTTSKLLRLTEIAQDFQDEKLKKIYSMSFSSDRGLLAAVGHGGRATIFGATGQSAGDVLMSFQAHKGWVASTSFLDSHLLLTAANDAVVTIWDIRKVLRDGTNQRPMIVATNNQLHNKGIFCAHVHERKLATASKDKTVSYCDIAEDRIVPVRWFDGLHHGVIKSVALRDVNILASTGNDCDVCVCDARDSKGLVHRVESVDSFSTNHVSWSPADSNIVMTASFGNTIKLWDIRKTEEPVHELKGHSMLFDHERGKSIYHPLFAGNGKYVITPGVKSDTLTIFDTVTGSVVSKGTTSIGEVTSIASCDIMGSRIAACRNGAVVLLDPVWS